MSKIVVIDPGHGPGNANGGRNGYKEYEGMWKLSNFLKTALEHCGMSVALTRAENADPSLTARGKMGAGADLFISEHSNAANGAARGVEVYYSIRLPGDRNFAAEIAKETAALMYNPNRGAKTRESTVTTGWDYYTIMMEAQKAGAKHVLLAESGFHDNFYDEAFLLSDANLKAIAETQARVICKYLGVSYKVEGSIATPSDVGNPTTELPRETVLAAIGVLVSHGVINSPDYWAANYGKLQYLDRLIVNMAGSL